MRIYHPSLHDAARVPPTYWHSITPTVTGQPLQGQREVDVAIIGAGYTGLSAALHLARDHQIEPLVLEAASVGWGASGMNAGFNTLAATKLSVAALFRRWGESEGRSFFASQLEGQDLVYQLAEQEGIALEPAGSGIYQVAHSRRAFAMLAEEAGWLARAGIPCRLLDAASFAREGHGGREQQGALHFTLGGGINPLALVRGLAAAARRHGAQLYEQSPVLDWQSGPSGHCLRTPQGEVRARQVILATNAYPPAAEPPALRRRVLPAISNMLVTRPLSAAQWQALGLENRTPMFDSRHLLSYYRRLPDDRLLFGARGDTSGSPRAGERMCGRLQQALAQKFPELGPLPVEYFWRGLVSVTRKLAPSWGALEQDPSVWYALGCFGNGVNTMPWIGRSLARAIAGRPATASERSAVYRGLPGRLPPSAWIQRLGLRMAYLRYALEDRLTD